MHKNIKIDLIYYLVNKDFEFEFNLCASCQMRLLTEITNDYNSFIHALARGVSRSRVILISAELTNELVTNVSDAIGYPVDQIDTAEFGIKNSSCDVIPTGGVPLVTGDGRFGGFILERGPQSLVFVSADREINHEIMLKLVQPYIADLSKTEPITDIRKETVTNEPDAVLTEEAIMTETEDTADNKADVSIEVEEIGETATQEITDVPETQEDSTMQAEEILTTENANDVMEFSDIDSESENTDEVMDFILDYESGNADDVESSPVIAERKNKKPLNLPIIILSIILALLILFIVYLMVIDPLLSGAALTDSFDDIFSTLFS